MTQFTTDRRTLVKGAAWAVPAVTVAAAAPSLAASSGECDSEPMAAEVEVTYAARVTNEGLERESGIWTAQVATSLPTCVPVNGSVPQATLTITLTTSDEAAQFLRDTGNSSVKGSSVAMYSVSGAVVNPGERSAEVTVPETQIPESGPITTTATGLSFEETAAGSPGAITVDVGNFTAQLTTDTGFVIYLEGTLDPAEQDTTLGTVVVQ